MHRKICHPATLVALVAATAIGTTLPAFADAPMNVRGTIVSASPTSITVQTAMGTKKLGLNKMTKIAGVLPSMRSAIKPGTLIFPRAVTPRR